MKIILDHKKLVKYPFLKESQVIVRKHTESIGSFLDSNPGKNTVLRARGRIIAALSPGKDQGLPDVEGIPPEFIIAEYVIARILASCANDRIQMDALARHESSRAFEYLMDEDPTVKRYVAQTVGIDIDSGEYTVKRYVECTSRLRNERWRLVNRDVERGMVSIESPEHDELLKESIFSYMRESMPLQVPEDICRMLSPVVEQIGAVQQEKMLEQFGEVDEECFPPCISALISAITEGKNLPHTARFTIVTFLHMIGMDVPQIVEVFCRAPDFDVERSMYQVEHITGNRGSTEYTPPTCATMRTYGICIRPDALCKNINHPLRYYSEKKRKTGKSAKKNVSGGKKDQVRSA